MFNFFKKLFKKKKQKKRLDTENYKISLNVKSMCMFEQLAQKSFFDCNEEDLLKLVYSCFAANNNIKITFEAFQIMFEDIEIAQWLLDEYMEISEFTKQFNHEDETAASGETVDKKNQTITDLAAMLIVECGMDPNYVMNEMELWEMQYYFKAEENRKKDMMANDRLWTYFTILPHVDGKKLKSPEKLIEFPWEKESKKNGSKEDLNKKEQMIKAFFANQKKRMEEQQNGS